MYKDNDIINRDISKEKFNLVQKNEKLYDQKIEGKAITYMQDVWMRFKKNKTNLMASLILLTLVVFSVIMPGLSGKDYTKLDEKLSFLPPRIPLIENLGILDGTQDISGIPVDLNTINEETGLYLPMGYNIDAIELETLKNDIVPSTEKSPSVINGQSALRLDYDSNSITIESNEFLTLSISNNSYIEIDVFELDSTSNGKIDVLLQTEFGGDYVTVASITETGKHYINVFEENEDLYADIVSKLHLRYSSDIKGTSASITSVSLFDSNNDEAILFDEGFNLSNYKIVDGKGSYQRENSKLIVASFTYNKYIAAFGLTHEIGFSSSEYDAMLEEWGDKVNKIENPENPDGWYFSEGFPIREVVKQNDSVVVDGKSYSSYEVYLDYGAYLGYEKLPYYLFGTSQAGRDLFSLVWVGLRTSLFLGIYVTIINVSIGVIYGSISGFYGGTIDLLMQRFAEIMGRLPWLAVLSIMVVLFDPGFTSLILTMVITGWIGTAGVTRMQFYRYKGREYVLASKTLGAKDARLIFKHILPNGIGTIITTSVLAIPYVIFTEAFLSYLGFGVGHGQSFTILSFTFSGVSIGVLLADARKFLFNYPYLTVFPSVIISILMITFNMFGNALRDAFNPSLRGVED